MFYEVFFYLLCAGYSLRNVVIVDSVYNSNDQVPHVNELSVTNSNKHHLNVQGCIFTKAYTQLITRSYYYCCYNCLISCLQVLLQLGGVSQKLQLFCTTFYKPGAVQVAQPMSSKNGFNGRWDWRSFIKLDDDQLEQKRRRTQSTLSYSRDDGKGRRLWRRPGNGAGGCLSCRHRLDCVSSHVTIRVVVDFLRSRRGAFLEHVPLMTDVVAVTVTVPADPAVPSPPRTLDVGRHDAPGYALQQRHGRADVHRFADVVIAMFGRRRQGHVDRQCGRRAAGTCGRGAVSHVRGTVQRNRVHRLAGRLIFLGLAVVGTRQFTARIVHTVARRAGKRSWTLQSGAAEFFRTRIC